MALGVFAQRRRLRAVALLAVALSAALGSFLIAAMLTPRPEPTFPMEERGPITVDGDDGFTAPGEGHGCECVRKGSGTAGDPYVIAGWSIRAEGGDGIWIHRASAWFVIKQVLIVADPSRMGIFIERSGNGVVEDVTVKGGHTGIRAFLSHNVKISRSLIANNSYGVHLEATDDSAVEDNLVLKNGQIAIFVRGSRNVVRRNDVIENGAGINVDGTIGKAEENVVQENRVLRNLGYGIGLWAAEANIVERNVVERNGAWGIALEDSSQNAIRSNRVLNNAQDGILIVGNSSANLVEGNEAEGNGDGVSAFDLHDESSGTGNIWKDNKARTKKPEGLR